MINHTKARYKTWLHRPYHDTPYFITTFLVYHREADGEASADEPCPMCRRPGIMACLGTLKQLLAAIILTTNDTEWRYVLGNILHCLRGWKLFIQYTNLLQCNIGKSEQPVLLPEKKKILWSLRVCVIYKKWAMSIGPPFHSWALRRWGRPQPFLPCLSIFVEAMRGWKANYYVFTCQRSTVNAS